MCDKGSFGSMQKAAVSNKPAEDAWLAQCLMEIFTTGPPSSLRHGTLCLPSVVPLDWCQPQQRHLLHVTTPPQNGSGRSALLSSVLCGSSWMPMR